MPLLLACGANPPVAIVPGFGAGGNPAPGSEWLASREGTESGQRLAVTICLRWAVSGFIESHQHQPTALCVRERGTRKQGNDYWRWPFVTLLCLWLVVGAFDSSSEALGRRKDQRTVISSFLLNCSPTHPPTASCH